MASVPAVRRTVDGGAVRDNRVTSARPSEGESARARPLVLVAMCVAAWALIPVIATSLRTPLLSDITFLAWSNIVSFLVLATAALYEGRWPALKRYSWRHIGALSCLGVIGGYLYYVLLFAAYDHGRHKYDVLACQYTWPVFTVLFSALLMHERVKQREAIALILALVSVALVAKVQHGAAWPPLSRLLMALAAAAMFGLFSAVTKSRGEHALDASLIYFSAASVAGVVVLTFQPLRPQMPGAQDFGLIVVYGAFVNGLSYVWWFKALSLARASALAPFVLATPILAALILVAKGAPASPLTFLGIAGVCLAGLLVQHSGE